MSVLEQTGPSPPPVSVLSHPTLNDYAPLVDSQACPQCGGPVESQDKFCPSCGAARGEKGDRHLLPERPSGCVAQKVPVPLVPGQQPPAPRVQKFFRCKHCGAEVAIDPDRRSYVCAFCDSPYVVEFTPEQTGRQTPEFVIGFAVTPQKALEGFRLWLGANSWFRPRDLRSASAEDKLQGIYLPFWSFSMLAQSQWAASIGEHWWRTETYTTIEDGKSVTKTRQVCETEWWDLAGRHHQYYSGYLVSASRGLAQREAEQVFPFHLAGLRRYEPYFLAGWLSEEYSVPQEQALALTKNVFYQQEQQNVAGFLPGDTSTNLRVETCFDDIDSDLILLPIYLMSYRYRGKLYRFLMSGQTGKAHGDKPLSWPKILILAGVILAAVLAVVLIIGASR